MLKILQNQGRMGSGVFYIGQNKELSAAKQVQNAVLQIRRLLHQCSLARYITWTNKIVPHIKEKKFRTVIYFDHCI